MFLTSRRKLFPVHRFSWKTSTRYFSKKSHDNHKIWAKRLEKVGLWNVFAELTPLAITHYAVNLGQGFPDFPGPDFLIEATKTALDKHITQYTRPQGHLRLVNALSKFYSPLFHRYLEPLTDIAVTVGATEGIYATMQTLIDPGDEVILIEPFYDSYLPDVYMAGGIPVTVPLRPKPKARNSHEWVLDMEELEDKITDRTKLLVINNPQNIPGKVYSKKELEEIAHIVKKHNLLVLSDEVYEFLTYDNHHHTRIATLPGMFERTITLGSAGKTFSVTGFKIGWAIGPKNLITAIFALHQHLSFCTSSTLQEGVAQAVEFITHEKSAYFHEFRESFEKKRDRLCEILERVNLKPILPEGSYFILADTSAVHPKHYFNESHLEPKELQFCKWLTKEIKVAAIPPNPFYTPQNRHIADSLVRFCFCKKEETLEEASKRLERLKDFQ
jgi:aspartate/methionine/tyrosine aminotransferase